MPRSRPSGRSAPPRIAPALAWLARTRRAGLAVGVLLSGFSAGTAAAQEPVTAAKKPAPGVTTAVAKKAAPGVTTAAFQQPPAAAAPPAPQGPADPPAKSPAPLPGPTLTQLGGVPFGGPPKATAQTQEKVSRHVQRFIDPEATLDLIAGSSRVMVLKDAPVRVQSGDEGVLAYNLITPRELALSGRAAGTTVLNLWFADPADPNKQETISYMVRVYPDPDAKERLERAYAALADEINKNFPDVRIQLKLIGDKVVASGRVRDVAVGTQVLRIVRASLPPDLARGPILTTAAEAPPVAVAGAPAAPGQLGVPTLDNFVLAGGPNVLNLLEVAGEQQVMLRVIVAEVSRTAARSIGLNFSITNERGITVFRNLTGLGGVGGGGFGGSSGFSGGTGLGGGGGGGGTNLPIILDAGRIPLALQALRTLNYATSLAEPTLVTLNGQTANFQAGGQFPVPIVGGFGNVGGIGGGGGLQGVSFIPFGVQLNFTPFITDRDRIRLILNASVSARDVAIGTNIGGGQVSGLNDRSVNTTVELRTGETLAVAGLIEQNLGGEQTRVPFLGNIPFAGQFTGRTTVSSGEKELVIFVTPDLVRPLDPGQCPPLPGSDIIDPTDYEFYIMGRMEGHGRPFRTQIRDDASRVKQYLKYEGQFVTGPTGYAPGP